MSKITFSERAWEEYLYWQGQDKKTLKRINTLLKDIERNPFEGIGKPEALKHRTARIVEAVLAVFYTNFNSICLSLKI